jgi:hypothetical protein
MSMSSGGGSAGGAAGGSAGGAAGGTAGGTAGGSAGGSSGGSAGGTSTLLSYASQINNVRFEVPCGTYQEADQVCDNFPAGTTSCPAEGDYNFHRTVTFGGAAGTVYDVALHVRGVTEPRNYTGGTSDGHHFYTGGSAPSDVYNVYSFKISSPPQIYFFNYDEGKGEGHYVFLIDHQKTVQIAGGATIEMTALDSNCSAIRNCQDGTIGPNCMPFIVPGVSNPDGGYNGQFVQIDVDAVTVH